ncbi:hypothetical protein PQR39_35435 [Paraburkholderia sediminicola]|uniref:ParE family toxin-like protein n=1 Tax=Paraburkholderia sediminicola TaxID=458836 RepID=UPI0038BC5F81
MADRLDLTKCSITGIRHRAKAILEAVAGGTHPLKLGGHTLESTESTVISVPVGLRFRLLFRARTFEPFDFMTHEQYNKFIRSRR